MKLRLIETIKESNLPYQKTCSILKLNPDRFYRWMSLYTTFGMPALEDQRPIAKSLPQKLLPKEKLLIIDYALKHPELRHRKLSWQMARDEVAFVSESTVYRVLDEAGLISKWPYPVMPKKKFDQEPTKPNELWHIDITYIPIGDIFWYLISILDSYSRYIVYWELCFSMTQEDVKRVIDFALLETGLLESEAKPKLLSDNGTQITAKSLKKFFKELGIAHIRTAFHHPQSNGRMEIFHKTIKYEDVYINNYLTPYEARDGIAKFINYYNTKRLHQAIGYVTPYERYIGKDQEILDNIKEKRQKALLERKTKNLKPILQELVAVV